MSRGISITLFLTECIKYMTDIKYIFKVFIQKNICFSYLDLNFLRKYNRLKAHHHLQRSEYEEGI